MPLPKDASHEFIQGYQSGVSGIMMASPYYRDPDKSSEWWEGRRAGTADRELMERVVAAAEPPVGQRYTAELDKLKDAHADEVAVLLERISFRDTEIVNLREENSLLKARIKAEREVTRKLESTINAAMEVLAG